MENLFYQPEISNGLFFLDHDESKHCARVLRKRPGEVIQVTDGKGTCYAVSLTDVDQHKCSFTIQSKKIQERPNYSIHLAISPTKNADRMEWMVEKCVEVGVDTITFIQCRNTERKVFKTDRVERIALSAMKQSQRYFMPTIEPLLPFKEFTNQQQDHTEKFIAYVDRTNPNHLFHSAIPGQHYVILIGPEGDFTEEELRLAKASGFKKVSLGRYRLRTETAGLTACQILNLVHLME
jgi:16S rRNA (uracil1498-N3)-methyltransferase